jgi:hypothetical protein
MEDDALKKILGERHQEIIALANLSSQFIGAALPYAQALAQTAKEALEEEDSPQDAEFETVESDVDNLLDSLLKETP